jgi:hypothetical protein
MSSAACQCAWRHRMVVSDFGCAGMVNVAPSSTCVSAAIAVTAIAVPLAAGTCEYANYVARTAATSRAPKANSTTATARGSIADG